MDEVAPQKRRKRDASPEELERLVHRLDPDLQSAWEKYASLHRKLVKFFEWNRCSPAADLADETLDRVAKRLAEEEIEELVNYSLRVAQYVRLEEYKRVKRQEPIPDSTNHAHPLMGVRDPEDEIVRSMDHERRLGCLTRCLGNLSQDDRGFIVDYYEEEGESHASHRQGIAERLGLSAVALRVKANRLRDKLESCVNDCLAASHAVPGQSTGKARL